MVSAATVMDGQDVVKDLENMGYDITAYGKDTEDKNAKILEFMEFCYDERGNQNDYGLYIYVYNPTAEPISTGSKYNTVQLYTVDSSGGTTMWGKVNLTTVSFSTGTISYTVGEEKVERDISHLFYKFKLDISGLKGFVSSLPPQRREYRIIDLELQYGNEVNPRLSKITNAYICVGFQGYHSSDPSSDHSSYFCTSNTLEAIEVELHPATWKTASSDKGENYQYEVSSVYFSLPDYYLRKYGDMSDENFKGLASVSGEWYEYKINGVVTNNGNTYSAVKPYLAKYVYPLDSSGNVIKKRVASLTDITDLNATGVGIPINMYYGLDSPFGFISCDHFGTAATGVPRTKCFNKMFPHAGDSQQIITKIHNVIQYDGKKFNNIGTEALMESVYGMLGGDGFCQFGYVDAGRKWGQQTYTIKVDDASLNDQIAAFSTDNTFIRRWLSGKGKLSEDAGGYAPISAIQMIKREDVSKVWSDESISDSLFVSQGDVDSLRSFYRESELAQKTVYLMRFAVTDYYFDDIFIEENDGKNMDGDNYYFEKTIFHNFDIMEFTFQNSKGEYTTVPVSTRPISVVGNITPIDKPNNDDDNGGGRTFKDLALWVKILVFVAGALLVLFILSKFGGAVKLLFSGVGWLVSAPFKLIGKAFDAGGKIKEEKRKSNAEKRARNEERRKEKGFEREERRKDDRLKLDKEKGQREKSRYNLEKKAAKEKAKAEAKKKDTIDKMVSETRKERDEKTKSFIEGSSGKEKKKE